MEKQHPSPNWLETLQDYGQWRQEVPSLAPHRGDQKVPAWSKWVLSPGKRQESLTKDFTTAWQQWCAKQRQKTLLRE